MAKATQQAKATAKKISNSTPSKEGQFVAKKIGANLIATIEGTTERYAKKVDSNEANTIMEKMKLYNKRPSKVKKEEIIALLTPEKAKVKKEKETLVSKAKGVKQQLKKEIKKSKGKSADKEQRSLVEQLESMDRLEDADIVKLQGILDKYKKVEEKAPEPKVTPAPRGGENYRRYN